MLWLDLQPWAAYHKIVMLEKCRALHCRCVECSMQIIKLTPFVEYRYPDVLVFRAGPFYLAVLKASL